MLILLVQIPYVYGAGIYFGTQSDAILDSSEISNNGRIQ